MSEEEIKQQEEQENEGIRKSLKSAGLATGILGGGIYGSTKGALALDKARKEGTLPKSLKKIFGYPNEPMNEEIVKTGKKIGKGLAIIGGATYGSTKAYEHYKNRKNKGEEK